MKRFPSPAVPRAFRSVLIACALALIAPLLGATTPVMINAPVVVVFPLVASQGLAPDVGSSISLVLASQIAELGGVNVKPAPPGTQQADFLATARKLGTDYYVTGFVSPLGDQVSVVEQLVSTKSGAVVWSNTVQLAVYGDARASGTQLHDAILQYAGRGFSTLDQAQVVPTPPPNKQRRVAAAPAPTPTPMTKNAAVLEFDGPAIDAVRNYAPNSVLRTLKQYGIKATLAPISSKDVASLGPLICAQTGADLLLGGSVATDQEDPERGWFYDAGVELTGYDCTNLNAKPRLVKATATNGNMQTAIDIAVAKALKDYMNPKFVKNP